MNQRPLKNSKGFTLLELVIVLLIMGVIMAVGIPRIFNGIEAVKFRNLVSEIIMFLRETRMDALSKGETVTVSVRLEEGVFEDSNGATYAIPEESGITVDVEDEYVYIDAKETSLTFYPNGTSSGGRLILSDEGKRAVIYLDHLTGLADYSVEYE